MTIIPTAEYLPDVKEVPHVFEPLSGGETDRCDRVRRQQEEEV